MGMPMIVFLCALACLQEAPPYRATMTLERHVKREDRVHVDSGDLLVRPGEALLYQSKQHKLLIRGDRALERKGAERAVKSWDLRQAENFQPLDLWRLDPRVLRERFQEIEDPVVARSLPSAVVRADGTPVAPVVVKPPAESLAWADGVDRAEGCRRAILVPRDPKLRARIPSIRLSIDRATGRLLHAVVDGPTQLLTMTIGDVTETAPLADAVFDWDLSNLRVEDR